jgi:hypothetical protein
MVPSSREPGTGLGIGSGYIGLVGQLDHVYIQLVHLSEVTGPTPSSARQTITISFLLECQETTTRKGESRDFFYSKASHSAIHIPIRTIAPFFLPQKWMSASHPRTSRTSTLATRMMIIQRNPWFEMLWTIRIA